MKKLLSAIAISFVLSGCMNNVSLPNTNIQGASSSSYELDYLGIGLGMAEVCKYANPKMKKKWTQYQDRVFKIVASYDQNDKGRIWATSMARVMSAYMSKNNIPMTGENLNNIYNQQLKDKRLEKDILKEAVLAMKGTDHCFNLNSSEKSLKEFVTEIGKENLL